MIVWISAVTWQARTLSVKPAHDPHTSRLPACKHYQHARHVMRVTLGFRVELGVTCTHMPQPDIVDCTNS